MDGSSPALHPIRIPDSTHITILPHMFPFPLRPSQQAIDLDPDVTVIDVDPYPMPTVTPDETPSRDATVIVGTKHFFGTALADIMEIMGMINDERVQQRRSRVNSASSAYRAQQHQTSIRSFMR